MAVPVAEFLFEQYNKAMSIVGSNETITSDLYLPEKILLDFILDNSERAKGVFTVFFTSVVYKILNP